MSSPYIKAMYNSMLTDMMFDNFDNPQWYWIKFLFKAHKAGY